MDFRICHRLVVAGMFAATVLLGVAKASELESSTQPQRVSIVRAAEWSQGDAAREGAAEFVVLMEIARLRESRTPAGLVGVGDRRGLFNAGAEQALHEAARAGLPVVKLARGGEVLPAPHGLFLDGGSLTEDEACRVLARCLERYGPLPRSTEATDDGSRGTARVHVVLQKFQREFTLANSARLALR